MEATAASPPSAPERLSRGRSPQPNPPRHHRRRRRHHRVHRTPRHVDELGLHGEEMLWTKRYLQATGAVPFDGPDFKPEPVEIHGATSHAAAGGADLHSHTSTTTAPTVPAPSKSAQSPRGANRRFCFAPREKQKHSVILPLVFSLLFHDSFVESLFFVLSPYFHTHFFFSFLFFVFV